MNLLLDVNVLIAWGWADHVDHQRVASWIGRMKKQETVLMTSAIPQLGFIRVSVQRMRGTLSPSEASEVLTHMIHALGSRHRFIADDQPSIEWPNWCSKADQTTDAHLVLLAKKHKAQLATLDEAIPHAYLIPRLVE
ncbi:MAG TPA: hypothetical protein PKE55_10380 [Kiritimatiellia bacterium]|nr:hypothetical protein [Kiritimatiellia bacterium]